MEASEAPASPPPAPRGIYDTLLGIRCRRLPPQWFPTVSEVGKRWVLESMASGGQIEVLAPDVSTASPVGMMEAFRQQLQARFPGAVLSEVRASEKNACQRFELDLEERAGDARHRYALLWRGGRAGMLHLANTARFFLYDLKAFQDMVDTSEIL